MCRVMVRGNWRTVADTAADRDTTKLRGKWLADAAARVGVADYAFLIVSYCLALSVGGM
jgi:hypothetical protein